MKTFGVKVSYVFSVFILTLIMVVIGVWAVTASSTIHLSGNVNFTVSDDSLYIRDIRIKDADDSIGQGTTIDNFLPGFISGSTKMNLGIINAEASFTLIFDVVNTGEIGFEANTDSVITNGSIDVSGSISGDGVLPTEVTSADLSGQIFMTVTIASAGEIDLSDVEISLEPVYEIYDVTLQADVSGNVLDAFIIGENGNIEYTNSNETAIQVSQANNKLCIIASIEGEIKPDLIDWSTTDEFLIYNDLSKSSEISPRVEWPNYAILYVDGEQIEQCSYSLSSEVSYEYYFLCYILTVTKSCTITLNDGII